MKNRLIWISACLLAAVLYLFENNAGTLTVWVGVLVVPVFGLLPLMGKGVTLYFTINKAQEKGQSVNGTLTVTNPGWLPKPRLRIAVCCRNLRTGEVKEQVTTLSLLPGQQKKLDFAIDCSHCGKVVLEVENVQAADLFDLFVRSIPCGAKTEFIVVPQLFEPAISLENHDMEIPDSDSYSPIKPGSDPGETFAVREYVPGDAIRKIHWKLSEKTDKLMVRDFGLPVINEVALLLETAGVETPDEADAMTEVFASVSAALISANIPHHVFWNDCQTNELLDYNISESDACSSMLEALMELPPREAGSISQQFMQTYPHCPYTHVIIVGGRVPAGTRDLYNGNRVSILVPHRDLICEGLQPDGTHVLSFSVERYAMDLCRLEV